MYRTATYWPPGSWEVIPTRGQNVAVYIQAIWTRNGNDIEVFLQTDVAEGGYLYDGKINEINPLNVFGAYKIDLFLTHPDLRSLRQVRKAILSGAGLLYGT